MPEAAERREPDRRPELADPLSERVGVGTCLELVQECQQARGPLAARRALAARLRRVEGEQRADDLDDGGVGGDRGDPARARGHAPLGLHRHVEEPRGNDHARGAADHRPLKPPAAGRAAADLLEERPQGHALPYLDDPGTGERTREPEELWAGRLWGAETGKPPAATGDDRRDGGQRLDVVDHRRLAPEARLGRERRARARLGAPALDRLEQRRLLAEYEAAGAAAELDRAGRGPTEHPLAHDARRPGLRGRAPETLGRQLGLAVNVKDRAARPGRVGGQEHPL